MAVQQLVIWLEEDEGDDEFEKLNAIGEFIQKNWNDSSVAYEVEEIAY